jgi:site-specific DNA recombinase
MAKGNSNGRPGPDRAVLYLRMSSAKQDASIDQQRDQLVGYAAQHGYPIVSEYLDEAISGDDTARRTEFLRMRDAAGRGEFSVVLCWDQDRFGRFDPIEGGYWILPFRDAGVRLETIAQGRIDWTGFAGRLLYVVQQEAKHAYLRDLSRNVTRGALAAARKEVKFGTGGGSKLYGYHVTADGTVEVVEPEAAVVCRIFVEYAKPGSSLRSVANMLNAEGIKTSRGTPWKQNSIRRILTNRKFTGAFVRFRYTSGKYHSIQGGEIVTRSKTDKQVEVEPLVVVGGNHEAIIDQALFDRVQGKLAQQQRHTARRDVYQYLLGGLVVCGDCQRVMRGTPTRHGDRHAYSCGTYHSGGKAACFNNHVTEDTILAVVVRKLQERYFGAEAIARMQRTIKQAQAAEAEPIPKVDQRRLRKRLEVLDQQIDTGAERVFTAPEAIVPKLYAKLENLRQERDQLQQQLDSVGRTETHSAADQAKEVEEAIERLQRLSEAFAEAEPDDIRELVTTVVSKIILEFTHKTNGKLTRSTCTGGKIMVKPDSGISSLLLPSANGWTSSRTHRCGWGLRAVSPRQLAQTRRSPPRGRKSAFYRRHGSGRGKPSPRALLLRF